MNRRRLLRRIQAGHTRNIRFADFIDLVEGFSSVYDHSTGSHQFYVNAAIGVVLNLQPEKGQAKPYQVPELLRHVKDHDLPLRD